jgi:hypothetical protein
MSHGPPPDPFRAAALKYREARLLGDVEEVRACLEGVPSWLRWLVLCVAVEEGDEPTALRLVLAGAGDLSLPAAEEIELEPHEGEPVLEPRWEELEALGYARIGAYAIGALGLVVDAWIHPEARCYALLCAGADAAWCEIMSVYPDDASYTSTTSPAQLAPLPGFGKRALSADCAPALLHAEHLKERPALPRAVGRERFVGDVRSCFSAELRARRAQAALIGGH